jgi:hypothetical protein
MIGQLSQHQQCGEGGQVVGDDGQRDAGVGEPVFGPIPVEQGIGAADAANTAASETTADKNASRSALPRLAWLIAGATFCIEPCLSLVLNHPGVSGGFGSCLSTQGTGAGQN